MLDHALAHQAVANYLASVGTPMSTVVYPSADRGDEDWLFLNSEAHTESFNLLGLGVLQGLLSVDLKNQQAYYEWMYYHAQIHALENQAAGL